MPRLSVFSLDVTSLLMMWTKKLLWRVCVVNYTSNFLGLTNN